MLLLTVVLWLKNQHKQNKNSCTVSVLNNWPLIRMIRYEHLNRYYQYWYMYRLWTIGLPEQGSLFNQDVTLFGRNKTDWCRRSGDCLPRVAVVYRPCLPGITATGVGKHSLAGDTSGKYCWFTFEFPISFWLLSRRLQFDMWFLFVCCIFCFIMQVFNRKKTPFTNGGVRCFILWL